MSFGSLQRRILGPIIPVIRIQGIITESSVSKLEKSLANFRPERAQAMAVLVNSPGGLIVPTFTVCDILKQFSKKHSLPIYTFAECIAASGGYGVISIGNKVYADTTSYVGSIGAIMQYAQLQGLLKKYGVDVRTWKTNENLFLPVIDPLADVNKENMDKNLKALVGELHRGFIEHVELYRDRKIKVAKEERFNKLYQADIWTGKEAVELGLVDGVGTFQEILKKDFPDATLQEVTTSTVMEKFRERFALMESRISSYDEQGLVKQIVKNFPLKK